MQGEEKSGMKEMMGLRLRDRREQVKAEIKQNQKNKYVRGRKPLM